MRASRRAVIVAATAAVLLVVAIAARHVIARAVLQSVLSAATGYDVRIGEQSLGTHHAALFDVHVVKNGDPVLDAQRVDVDYALRDIFPGGQHRFGFAAIAIQKPVLTITRHADGTLTFNRTGGTSGAAPAPTRKAAAPYYFTARVRDGVIRLVDAAPLQPDLANQTIEHVSIDASVKSDTRTTAKLDGVLLARRAPGAGVERYPLSERTVIDVQRGIALNTITAARLPLRGALGFFIHSKEFRFDDGVLDRVVARYFALAPKPGDEFSYKLGGRADLSGGRIFVAALAHPIRDLSAPLLITDDTLAATTMNGTVNGIPLGGRGAIYDLFGKPAFRMAFAANADLHDLRTLFTFMATMPLRGASHFETLLGSSLAKPLIRSHFSGARVSYDRYPADAVDATIDYFDGALTFGGVRARYGSADVAVGGRILFTDQGNDIAIAVNARGPGRALPYADAIAPDAAIVATALLHEPPGRTLFDARGTIGALGGTTGAGTFAVDQRGVGAFGPFQFERADGEAIAGGFQLERPISQSAGWLHARAFRLADVRRAARLPGGITAALPPISGVIDGDFAGGGTPDAFLLAGTLSGRDLRYGPYALGSGTVRLGGTMNDVRLAGIRLDGPMGRFQGDGAYDGGLFALEGTYDGRLEQLRPFIADASASGPVHGAVRATIAQNRIVVQTTGAELPGARIRGIAIDRVAGTLAVDGGKTLRVVAANGSIGGGEVVAGDAGGPFLVSAPGIPVAALRGAGLPLEAGSIGFYGLADIRGRAPAYDGLVTLDDGIAAGYPVSGGADLALNDGTATIRAGVAAFGKTYGRFDGRVLGIGTSGAAPAYDLNAQVPIGDVGEVRRTLRLPVRYLEGSFSAGVRVRGNGARPRIAGDVAVPEGSYNGLAFRDARAGIVASPSALAASGGSVTVGSTRAQLDAAVSVASRAFSVDVRSANANLADFDDYFDEGETLEGRGRVALMFANDGRATRTSGNVSVRDFRYRRFAFGTTDATWSERAGAVSAALNVRGTHGALRANGSVVAAAGDPLRAMELATYRANVQARGVDLGTWLPPFGITAPLLGQVDARGSIAGRWPNLAVSGDASLMNGSVYGYKVVAASGHASGGGRRVTLSNTSADLGFARFTAAGSFGFSTASPLALSVHGEADDVARVVATLLPHGPRYDVGGSLQADTRITGSIAKPRLNLGFAMTNARYRTLAIPRVLGNVNYDGKRLDVGDAEATFAKGNAVLAGALPLTLEPFGVTPNAPLSFTLALSGVDLAQFSPFVPGPKTTLGGTVDGRVAIEGTIAAPRVIGAVALANGSYVSDFDRAGITKANAQLAFQGTSIALQALHANLGNGTLDGRGDLELPFANARAGNYAMDLTARGARVDSPYYGTGSVDGALRLRNSGPLPVLSGDVTLSNASIPILAIYRNASAAGASGGAAAGDGAPLNFGFDVVAHAGKNVRIQASAPYIDIGTSGTLDLTGTLRAPKLAGVLTATPGGLFSTYNRAFRVQSAQVAFNPANGVLPYIDLRAYAHVTNPDPDPNRNAVGSADITVSVDGPADELAAGTGSAIQYASNPPYSQEQIIGLLLDASVFGAVNFGQQQNGTTLRGAPGESNPLLPPGVTPSQTGVINFNQEAFSVLNGQLTQRFLAPVERIFTGRFGLTDFELTVDYGGGIGYSALKQLGKRDVYASFGQTLSSPVRSQLGFTARPDATTSVQFSYFRQNGSPAITSNANGSSAFSATQRLRGIQAVNDRQGFTFSIVRKYP